eukprot:COSAG02_NODE_49695_length_325_cov_0.690265_1_plen_34_part_01
MLRRSGLGPRLVAWTYLGWKASDFLKIQGIARDQ